MKRITFEDGSDSDTYNNQTQIGTTTKLPPIKTQNTSKDLGIVGEEEKSETDDNQASPTHAGSPTIGSHNGTGRNFWVKKEQPDDSQDVDNPKALSEAEQKSKDANDAKVAERGFSKRSYNRSNRVVMDSEEEDEKGGEAGSQKLVKKITKSVAESLGISKDGNDSEDNGSDSKDDAKTTIL